MNNLPPLPPPPRPHSPSGHRSQSSLSQSSVRSESDMSTTSNDSSLAAPQLVGKRSPYHQQQQPPPARPATSGGPTPGANVNLNHQPPPRPQQRTSVDGSLRTVSPSLTGGAQFGHRGRQHSQGFFEPSLPHASSSSVGLSASQIAAQTAMHHISPPPSSIRDERKRSYPGLAPINTSHAGPRRQPSDTPSPQMNSAGGLSYANGTLGGNRLAATTAANAAFPTGRSPLPSPGLPTSGPAFPMGPPPDKEPKSKSSKMKLFSKPKNIGLSKDREARVAPAMPSPGRGASSNLLRGGFASASTVSLAETGSSASSIYSGANASTSTLVPAAAEREKEKRHNFLSRQKHKLKEEPSQLPLSSAHSNSQPTNPEKPQTLYNFTPESPGGASAFTKTMSGFDLRHGRLLREKRKEEKAAAKMELSNIPASASTTTMNDAFGTSGFETNVGQISGGNAGVAFPNDTKPAISALQLGNIGASMGVPAIGPDDAWPLLKARLLNIFSGEELRTPIEDFNTLVGVHIRRCVQLKQPAVVIEDLRELLKTGFNSLSQTLRGVPDDRLVTKLVEMWIGVYGSILPFLQAVFLPMDLEFKGRGHIMSVRDAQDFWSSMPESLKSDDGPSPEGGTMRLPTLGEELDVRRVTLIAFRDTVILPRHESLMAIFSRLSLDRINAESSPAPDPAGRQHAKSDPASTAAGTAVDRPGTAGSLSPHMNSFTSQGSTLLDAASTSSVSGGAMSMTSRSRATSNTSAGSFGTSMPRLHSPLAPPSASLTSNPPHSPQTTFSDPTRITETVARMLQCLYVLASCQTGDVGQGVVERLTGALKYNWLGRGRTGRDRRGWVGMRNPPGGGRVGLVGA